MVKRELILDKWNVSYFDNHYVDIEKEREGTLERKKQLPINMFFDKIKEKKEISYILPANCRYSININHNSYKLFVIEEPPQMRTMFLNYDMSMTVAELKATGDLKKFGYENWFKENQKPYKFYLAFPYLIYIILVDQFNNFKELKVFSRVTPLNSFGDYLCIIPLMNINKNQRVCTGTITSSYSNKTVSSAINGVIKTFWGNVFNKDYIYNVQSYNDIPFVCDYLTWQYYSKVDPMFIYNVEWIPYDTIGNVINKVENSNTRFDKCEDNGFQKLVEKIFYEPTLTTKIDEKTKTRIYDNMADSINIERIPIFVNDSFMIKNKKYFVRSFMSPGGASRLTHIKLEDSNKKIIIYKLTKLFENYLRESIMKERFIQSITLKDGSVVKQGSIIKSTNIHGNEIYNKILYMRYGIDGKIEARIKSSLIALEDIKNIKVMNMKKILINGIKLTKNKIYDILFDYKNCYSRASAPVKIIKKLRFNDLDILPGGKMTTLFEEMKGDKNYWITSDDLNKRLINPKGFRKLPSICRLGTTMIANLHIKTNSYAQNYLFIDEHNIYKPDYNETMNVIFKDKEHLFIESFDMDLSFKVGDKVVTSNWINPIEMLKVKTITGFLSKDNNLNILLEDQHGNKSEHIYLNKSSSDFTVNVGTLRHIEKEYDGMTSGLKIQAKKPQIFNFPMKDVNIIVGFLTDTGGDVPLALCSNGATLWADELKENFNLISMNNKKWKSLKHIPMIYQKKFKYQPGDMTTIPYSENRNLQNLLCLQLVGDRLVTQYLSGEDAINPYSNGYFYPELKTVVDRIGFLTPRYSQTQLKVQPFVRAYPNFHGMYTINPDVCMSYPVEERRILNVSNIPV